jgi:hypothetical protein
MTNKTMSLDYANNLIYELEKAFYDERGKGARFRLTTLGREFLREKCLPRISSNEIDKIIPGIESVLLEEGIASKISYTQEERLLRVTVESCVHIPVEKRMIKGGNEPFACFPANLIVLAIEEKLSQPVELAEIKLKDGACEFLLVVFDKRPPLG